MSRLIVDAGPFIAIFHRQDTQHHYCVDRLKFLIDEQHSLITTFPVLCEVHKLIQRYTNPILAQQALFELVAALNIFPRIFILTDLRQGRSVFYDLKLMKLHHTEP